MMVWPFFLVAVMPFGVMGGPADTQAIQPSSATSLPFAIPQIEEAGSQWQVVIEERIIIRVPARRSSLTNFSMPAQQAVPRGTSVVWREKKGPKCVTMRDIAAMQTTQRDSIDIITRQNQRLRAQLDRGCRALDFYAGFYMERNRDGRLCEGRDQLHARTGAKCEVAKFRLMVPETRED
jgi:hypothetical protein